MNLSNVIVVVRSAGERTIEPCRNLLLELFPTSDVQLISEVPFSKAVEKSFKLGINSGKEWLACIDADVLISKEQTIKFFEFAFNSPPDLFCIQSLILDKFFPIKRPSGIHLYRTKLCEKAIKFIPKEGLSLRPESFLKREMAILGYPTQQSNVVVGIHDFEQYYADIYRKCFLQAHKHKSYIKPALEIWRSRKEFDMDYQIAIYGATAGSLYADEVLVDKRFLEDEAVEILNLKGIEEKEALDPITNDEISNIIHNSGINRDLQGLMFPESMLNILYDKRYFERKQGKKEVKWREELLFKLIRKIGSALIKCGKLLHEFAIKK
ncbi:hypothetical protein [Cognataquiflexum rubidum]|uniref:hypothetical protein n=1 Tax=Cognataquiflexum rubidum TaxID=2922273 RepID=UPI001F12EAA5|nr:hypothetical protein [Cognataquiflexum rubidum]MCH6236513.1 hypothetical protein [Cognataquiflexum rubidum]